MREPWLRVLCAVHRRSPLKPMVSIVPALEPRSFGMTGRADSSTAVSATAGVLVVLASRKCALCAVAVGLHVTLSKAFHLLAEHA